MKIFTEVKYQFIAGTYVLVSEKSFEYDGPVALCDRWAQGQEKQDAANANQQAGIYGGAAAAEGGKLDAFATQEMNAQHSINPEQVNELLTSAGAGIGGATGSAENALTENAARTRNASGFTKSLDEMAREKMKAGAGVGEGVAAQDVAGTTALHQEGANLMAGQRGVDVGAQLKAMGQASEDTMAEVQAGQTGWLQNVESGINTASNAAGAFCPAEGSAYLMGDGTEKLAETLKVGELLKGIDGEPETIEEIQVAYAPIVRVVTDDGFTSRSSRVHAFALPFGGFVVALNALGKMIRTAKGVGKVVSVTYDGMARVFNVITDGSHTYRSDGIWALGVGEAERHVSMETWDKIGDRISEEVGVCQ